MGVVVKTMKKMFAAENRKKMDKVGKIVLLLKKPDGFLKVDLTATYMCIQVGQTKPLV